jgi:hypothetical protein
MDKHKFKPIESGQRNQCPSCGGLFNSNTAFSKHRIGQHGVDRRCATPDEMISIGMHRMESNFWASKGLNTVSNLSGDGKKPSFLKTKGRVAVQPENA